MENVFEIVGIFKYDFIDEKTNERVKGTKIYYTTEPTPQQKAHGFMGKVCDKISFAEGANIPSTFSCGQHYEFLFAFRNGKCKVSGFKPVNLSNK